MKWIVFNIFILFLFLSNLQSQNLLDKAIERLAKEPSLKNASLGISVLEVASGKQIAAYFPNQSLKPASSLKVVTTGVALALLGNDFRFKTVLEYDGTIDSEGTLHGNLYIKGYGDPTLGSDHFKKAEQLNIVLSKWVRAIRQQGIKKIDGQIVGDASFFDSSVNGRTWLWEDMGNYYASGAWGLNIHENRYFLKFQQTARIGEKPEIVGISPQIPNLLLMNELQSAERTSGDNAYIFGVPYDYTRFVRGTIPIGSKIFTIKGSIPDPPFFAAHSLLNKLEASGISTRKLASSQFELDRLGESRKKRIRFYTYQSPTLKEIVKETNLKSVNLYCEAMLRMLGQKKTGIGNAAAGLEQIKTFWEERGLNLDGFFMEDGSGLSPQNAVSAFHLASILRKIARDQKLFPAFYDSLPIAGQTGTLRGMFKNSVANGKLRAKSGGMTRVRSYTGYAKTKSGKLLAFCVIVNNFSGKSAALRNKLAIFMETLCRID